MPASSEANLSEIVLTPGRTTLAELEQVWRGRIARIDELIAIDPDPAPRDQEHRDQED